MRAWILGILFLTALWSQGWSEMSSNLEPQAPLHDFALPFFNREGQKVWDLRGAEAIIGKETNSILLKNLYLRLFDELDGNTLKIVMESPMAQIDNNENRITGKEFIHVVGHLFTAMGDRWTFFGEDHSIILEEEVQVFFETDLARTLAGEPLGDEIDSENGFTVVSSESLQISDTTDGFIFDFLQNVEAKSGDCLLRCNELEVETHAEAPIVLLEQKISNEHIRQIRASGNVFMRDNLREIMAKEAEFFPASGVAIFTGNVIIKDNQGTLRGERIVLRNQEKHIVIDSDGQIRNEMQLDID